MCQTVTISFRISTAQANCRLGLRYWIRPTVAMRTPYDLARYPGSATHLCAYSIVPASVGAVADALFGQSPIGGRLPVDIPGLYPRGHGLEVTQWP